jgi:hypothetical protein
MFQEADAAMRQATAMFERLSEFKTTSGRAVNIQKAMSPDKIDLPTEYMKRLAESERARGLVGQERIDFIRSQYEQFVKLPKEAQLELFEKEGAISGWEGFTNKWNAIVKPGLNIWRASLVSQLATAMRNFTSQGLAGVWNLFDDVVAAATGTIVEGVGGKGVTTAWKKHSAGMIEDVVSFARQFSPEDRKMLQQLLSSEAFAEVREKLIRTPVTMLEAQQRSPGAPAAVRKFQGFAAKYGDYLTFVNRLGETQERLYFFEAAFREQLRRTHPELLKTMDFKNLPFDQFRDVATMAANAADQALRLTFAKDFKGGAAGKFLEFTQQPVIDVLAATSGAATFPRFMANAFNWLYRHSPGPFLEIAMSQTNRKAFLAGNPEAVKAFSGAVTGSVLGFGAALKIRSDERLSEGARWYEIRLPNGKYLDTRAYAPLITPYLFTAELVLRGNRKVNWDDFREGILMTRLAGTGRFMAQLFSGRLSGQSASRLAVSAVGEFLGGFFQPINTIKDAVAGWNEEEAKFRDTKQNPILGPVMVKIPGLSRLLPEAVSPTRAGARKSESPWLRQMSGLTENSKNALEERLTEIGYPTGNLYPKMGEPRANWIVTKYLGEIAEERAPMLLQRLDSEVRKMREQGLGEKAINEIQRERVTQAYSNWKEVARRRALREDPALFRQVKDERARGSRKITLLRSGRAVR